VRSIFKEYLTVEEAKKKLHDWYDKVFKFRK